MLSRSLYLRIVFVGTMLAFSLLGCTVTRVAGDHPLVAAAAGNASATVYFLRPEPERRMGFADNPVVVELNQDRLMKLGLGEYTVVRLVPRASVFTLRNWTEAGPNWDIRELERQYRFEFEPGQTYFIVVTAIDGEFRGVHFLAESVDAIKAREVAVRLRPVGDARSAQLADPPTF